MSPQTLSKTTDTRMTSQQEDPKHLAPRLGGGMIALAWILALGLLTLWFNSWLTEQKNPNQAIETTQSADGAKQITLKRNRYGHYMATGSINGHAVAFLVDTGATNVAVPANRARRLGLQKGPAITVQTANGATTAWLTRLEQIKLGDIVMYDVSANISPGMHSDEILLGMSFLRNLEFTQKGDILTIRQY